MKNPNSPAPSRVTIVGSGATALVTSAAISAVRAVRILSRTPSLQTTQIEAHPRIDNANAVEVAALDSCPVVQAHEPVILCVKAAAIEAILQKLRPALRGDTTVVLASNGLGIFQDAAEILGRSIPIVRFLLTFGCVKQGPFQVTWYGKLSGLLASPRERAGALHDIAALLSAAGFQIKLEDNIALAEWKKLLVNIPVNSLATIANSCNRVIVERPELKLTAREMMSEVRLVAAAEGFALDSPSDQKIFEQIEKFGDNINSTLAELRGGTAQEVDFIFGRFVRLAQSYNIAVPKTEAAWLLLRALVRDCAGNS